MFGTWSDKSRESGQWRFETLRKYLHALDLDAKTRLYIKQRLILLFININRIFVINQISLDIILNLVHNFCKLN